MLYSLLLLLNILNIDPKRELVILLIKAQGKVDCKDFNDRCGYVIDLI